MRQERGKRTSSRMSIRRLVWPSSSVANSQIPSSKMWFTNLDLPPRCGENPRQLDCFIYRSCVDDITQLEAHTRSVNQVKKSLTLASMWLRLSFLQPRKGMVDGRR